MGLQYDPVRMDMTSGKRGVFIGAVHRMAAALEGRIDRGAYSQNSATTRTTTAELGLPEEHLNRGYESWCDRAGSFRSLRDGRVDFRQIFTKLKKYGVDVWTVLEWECCFKHPEQGAHLSLLTIIFSPLYMLLMFPRRRHR